jgi:predicted ABC-type transport system involved in lysophospholipase L1 biosynthesis ATPase subunit
VSSFAEKRKVRERRRTLLLVTHERDAAQAAKVSFKLEAGELSSMPE